MWAIARSGVDLARALWGFAVRNEGWMAGFDWEPLEFDEMAGWARLPDHHPMSGRSGLTMDGFETLPAIGDEDYEDGVR
ncbi:hypothetical protein [Streptosporangium sandarakinum]|uniref:hypothetical protein n=1 Tax=Streptosporangium sandarakinum TaxID=1260955 RepID=UPI00343A32DE